jgi:hypothetical protein
MNILDDVTRLEAEGYLQLNSDESTHTHEPLSYHNKAWPDGVADLPPIVVGPQQFFEEWITHIA